MNVYNIKTRVVDFFHCRVCPRKATCEYSKRHTFIFLSHNLISSHVVYMVHGTWLKWIKVCCGDRYTPQQEGFGLYMIKKRASGVKFPLFLLLLFSTLIAIILYLFLCLLVKRNIKRTRFKGPVHQLYMYVLIKGHGRYDQNAIGLVTFESQGKGKENLHICFLKLQK